MDKSTTNHTKRHKGFYRKIKSRNKINKDLRKMVTEDMGEGLDWDLWLDHFWSYVIIILITILLSWRAWLDFGTGSMGDGLPYFRPFILRT